MKKLCTQLVLSIVFLGITHAQDLSVTSFSFQSRSLASGGSYNPSLKIKNSGTAASVSSYAGFYLSKDSVLTVSDRFISSLYIPELAKGSETELNSGINLPPNITDGNYYIFVYADYQGQVFESNEQNNAAAFRVSVTAPVTDFVITAAQTASGSVYAGEQLTVSATLNNLGNTSAYAYTGFYLSQDTIFDGSDVQVGTTYTSYIQPGAPSVVEAMINVPSDFTAGSYHLIFVADYMSYVTEANENNNTVSRSLNVLAPNYTNVPATGNKTIYACDTKIYDHGGPSSSYSPGADGSLTIYPETPGKYISVDFTSVYLESGCDYVYIYDGTSASAPLLTSFSYTPASNIYYASNSSGALTIRFRTDGSVQYSGFEAKISCVSSVPKPDLSIKYISTDSVFVPGSGTSIYISEFNNGALSASYHNISYYLSADSTFSIGDTYLSSSYSGSLPAGGSQGISTSVYLPAGSYSGIYYLLAIADFDNYISESNEDNNVKSLKVNIRKPETDLRISSFSTSYNKVAPGESLNVMYTVENRGNVAVNYHTLGFYLSSDTTFSIGDTYIAATSNFGVYPGSYYSSSVYLTLPANALKGDYYLIAVADPSAELEEKNESNNLSYIPLHIVEPDVDLEVSNHFIYSFSGLAGTYPGIYTQLTNTGSTAAAPSNTGYYLSADSIYNAGDTFLSYYNFPAVPAGETRYNYLNLYLPGSVPTGTYYVIAVADYDQQVKETKEDNNTKAVAIEVLTPYTDLQIKSLDFYNSTNNIYMPGDNFNLIAWEQNVGNTSATAHYIYYYLSADSVYGIGDTYLTSSYNDHLYENTAASYQPFINIPVNTKAGKYYIVAVADYNNNVQESVETNNTRSLPVTISMPDVDLSIPELKVTGNPEAGFGFTAQVKLSNLGTTNAGYHYLYYFLSADSVYDTGDTYLELTYLTGLQAGQQTNSSQYLSLPSGKSPGTYFLIAITDFENNVSETNENNNVKAFPIHIAAPHIDLRVEIAGGYPSTSPGSTFGLYTFDENIGNQDAPAHEIGYFLSSDSIYNSSDVVLTTNPMSVIKARGNILSLVNVEIPENTTSGTYYVLVIIDYKNQVTESSKANNLAYYKTTVTADSVTDLSVAGFDLNYKVAAPGGSAVSYMNIKSSGVSKKTMVKVGYYLSGNNTIDPSDILLDSASVYTYQYNIITHKIPGYVPYGEYFIIAVLDLGNYINESDEYNNAYAIPITISQETGMAGNGSSSAISIYPNPATSVVNIQKAVMNDVLDVEIYDVHSQLVYSAQNVPNTLNISDLPSGVYMLRLKQGDAYIHNEKLVVTK